MTQRPNEHDAAAQPGSAGEPPSPDAVSFIRFCHHRKGVGWPELYDEMCGVAARREFRGWDHGELESRGLAFSLFEMPRLSRWVRTVLEDMVDERESDPRHAPAKVGHQPQRAIA
ncbi:MAG: hypothetical protein M3406_13835 [Chloroflexota bacterium]|nr:hypothetical protein [Chloroflexota bacterium]